MEDVVRSMKIRTVSERRYKVTLPSREKEEEDDYCQYTNEFCDRVQDKFRLDELTLGHSDT